MNLTKADREELQRLEESLWRADVRFSREKMEDLLDESFVEIGASGRVYDRQQTLDARIEAINAQLPLPEFTVKLLVPDVVLLTYRSVQARSDGSKKEARRSSIWMKKGDRWRILFHQGTLVQ